MTEKEELVGPWEGLIEPQAGVLDESMECCAKVSLAISAKRIADTLDQIKKILGRMA